MAKKKSQKAAHKESFWKKCVSPMVLWNLGGMIVFVVVVLVATWVWMSYYTHHGESVTVPDVEGQSAEYAIVKLRQEGLSGVVTDSSYNEKIAPGEVLDQYPKAGSHVKTGREIHLTINNICPPSLAIPDLADNCSRNQAETKLRAMGFKVTDAVTTPGDKDWVYGVRCEGKTVVTGQRVRVDKPLTLVVGDGSTNPDYVPEQTPGENEGVDDDVVDEIIRGLF